MPKDNLKRLVSGAIFVAFAYLAVLFIRIPIIPGIDFLKLEPKDTIIAIGGFIYGPITALMIVLVASFLEMITISSTGIIGFIMNCLASLAFVLPAALLYRQNRHVRTAIGGLILGSLLMTIVMIFWNYLLTPLYTGWPRSEVIKILVPAILPFNLIKGTVNSILTILIYKPLVKALRLHKLAPKR